MNNDNPTEDLVHMISVEATSLQRRLEEINQQIETYEQMVRREETRNSDFAAAIKTVKDNYESMPREDILTRYDEALDARHRLATMRGQLEQFKATQELIENEQAILNDILGRVDSGIEISDGDGSSHNNKSNNSSGLNIRTIIQAQEDERRRLANQMHDGPAQSLTNFVLQAEICQRLFDRNPDSARAELDVLKESASVTFQRVRDFISDLRPMMLDDLGVIPTVRRYVESFENKSDISINLDVAGKEDRRLVEYQEVMLFRGIQDLMAQARDFADAKSITIKLDIEFNNAVIVVEDDGRPFDTEALMNDEQPDDPRAQAIQTQRDKFDLIGGNVTVNSGDAGSTQVRIEMEVSDADE